MGRIGRGLLPPVLAFAGAFLLTTLIMVGTGVSPSEAYPALVSGAIGDDPSFNPSLAPDPYNPEPQFIPANQVDLYHFQITGPGRYAMLAEVFAGRIGSLNLTVMIRPLIIVLVITGSVRSLSENVTGAEGTSALPSVETIDP